MDTIGLIVKSEVARTKLPFVKSLVSYLLKGKKTLLFDEHLAPVLKKPTFSTDKIMQQADLVIVLGGDGTILRTARAVPNSKKTYVFSVNMGKLGFLTDVDPDKMFPELEKVLNGKFHLDVRFLLRLSIYRNGKKVNTSLALNEAVINQGCFSRLIDIRLEANQRKLSQFEADGLIVATPTGSTGHALSAGGPIVHPSLSSFVIIPLCPTTLAHRPIIIPNNRQLTVIVNKKIYRKFSSEAGLTLDGQLFFPLQYGDHIKIRRSRRKLYLIRTREGGYYKMLREKLGWSED